MLAPMQPVTVLGGSNIDFVINVPRLPAPGETVTQGAFMQAFGGKGANQAVAVARANCPTRYVNAVGAGSLTEQMLAQFRADGMDLTHVEVREDAETGAALIMVDREGRNCIAVAPGANDLVTPEWVERRAEAFTGCAMLVLTLETPVAGNEAAIRIAKRAGVPVQLNFAPATDDARHLAPQADVLIVNEIEAAQLTGESVTNPEEAKSALRALAAMGPRRVVITMGAAGVLAFERDEEFEVPAMAVAAVDTTAAGDTFCGYLAAATAQGVPLREALAMANQAAGNSVAKKGAQPSIPKLGVDWEFQGGD